MSEEEIIEDLKSLSPSENAILGILDLYNKEKEKTKQAEHNYDELTKITGRLKTELEEEKEKNKKLEDKIKEILKKDRDCMSLGYYSAYIGLIDDIQELLYKE